MWNTTRCLSAFEIERTAKPYSLKVNIGLFGMLALFPAERSERVEPTTRCCMVALLGALPVRNIFQLELESTGKPMPMPMPLSLILSRWVVRNPHSVCVCVSVSVRVCACVCVRPVAQLCGIYYYNREREIQIYLKDTRAEQRCILSM